MTNSRIETSKETYNYLLVFLILGFVTSNIVTSRIMLNPPDLGFMFTSMFIAAPLTLLLLIGKRCASLIHEETHGTRMSVREWTSLNKWNKLAYISFYSKHSSLFSSAVVICAWISLGILSWGMIATGLPCAQALEHPIIAPLFYMMVGGSFMFFLFILLYIGVTWYTLRDK